VLRLPENPGRERYALAQRKDILWGF